MPDALFSLKNTTSIVTGANGYLGREMAYALAESGSKVFLQGRDELKLEQLSSEMKSKGFIVEKALFDVRDESQIKEFFRKLSSPLNILINNAYSGSAGSIESSSKENFQDSFEISVISAFMMTKYALPCFRLVGSNETKSIINIASMYGMVSPDLSIYDSKNVCNPPFYGAAKAGLIQFSKYSAEDLSVYGIRVNSISPGPFPSVEAQENVTLMSKIQSKTILKRLGSAEEIKGPIIFLASKASSYVTGTNLIVDGGWTAK